MSVSLNLEPSIVCARALALCSLLESQGTSIGRRQVSCPR